MVSGWKNFWDIGVKNAMSHAKSKKRINVPTKRQSRSTRRDMQVSIVLAVGKN